MKSGVKAREPGQGLIEYALIIVLLAIGLIVALNVLGGGVVSAFYNNIIAIL